MSSSLFNVLPDEIKKLQKMPIALRTKKPRLFKKLKDFYEYVNLMEKAGPNKKINLNTIMLAKTV